MSRHPDLEAEQAYIDRAYEHLEEARRRAVSLRSMVEVGRGGTTQARYERDVIEEQILNRLSRLQLGSASLIFGRIDTESDEQFHIGRLAVADEKQEPVVVDWRAPVAEAFYRATGRDPMGLVMRRHFVSRGRELIDIEDELFDLDRLDDTYQGHGALVAALEQNRDGQLRDIVATIQGEQDEIIRHSLKGTVVVQGGPGTGKTVVALHRAAYLLYTHRFPLEGQGVLVIGPNRLFLRYIERVLPSLGEAGVHLTVLADLLEDLFPDTRVTLVDSPEQAAVKGDPIMVDLIREAVRDRERPLRRELTVDYGVIRLRLSVAESERIIGEARRRYRHHNAARRFVETEVFTALAHSHRSRPDPATVAARLAGDTTVRAALERMWPVLSPHELLRDLFGSAALLRSAATRAVTADGRMADWRSLRRDRGPDLGSYAWSDADVPLLDEAHVCLGPHPDRRGEEEIRTYGHIVVDEAQDHTPMALRMIARRSLNGSMTLVGDIAQATSPGAADSWDDVLGHLPTGSTPPEIRELTLSYRIPGPNLKLALRILSRAAPGITPPVAVREKGEQPEIREVPDPSVLAALGEAVREELVRLEGGSLAVIVPSSVVADAHRVLSEAGIEHGTATNASRNVTGRLHPRVTVVPVSLVKGLELDGSIVVEPSTIVAEEPQGLRALYVAMTRSTKRLVVLHSRPLPECLTADSRAAPREAPGPLTLGGRTAGRETGIIDSVDVENSPSPGNQRRPSTVDRGGQLPDPNGVGTERKSLQQNKRRTGPMNEEIPKAAWKKFLDDVTEFRAGWLVTLELLDPDYGDQHEADRLPLFTIEYDDEDDAVIVELLKADDSRDIGLRHLVEHPTSIEADPPAPNEVGSIRIQSPENVTIVELQAVPELSAE